VLRKCIYTPVGRVMADFYGAGVVEDSNPYWIRSSVGRFGKRWDSEVIERECKGS
jgi:hypothetical protein